MSNLTAAQRVKIARMPGRPGTMDFVHNLFTDVFVCQGDRLCREDPSIRLTFDKNIRSRTDHLHLSDGDQGRIYLQEAYRLMELKVPGAFPMWLVRALSRWKIYPTSFSKYGSIYTQELAPAGLTAGREKAVGMHSYSEQGRNAACVQVY